MITTVHKTLKSVIKNFYRLIEMARAHIARDPNAFRLIEHKDLIALIKYQFADLFQLNSTHILQTYLFLINYLSLLIISVCVVRTIFMIFHR